MKKPFYGSLHFVYGSFFLILCKLNFYHVKELLTQLRDLGDKAEYLSQRLSILVEENRSLKAQVAGLESDLEAQAAAHRSLTEQYDMLKLARSVGEGSQDGNPEAELLKKKINDYIREIDQCLRLIGD